MLALIPWVQKKAVIEALYRCVATISPGGHTACVHYMRATTWYGAPELIPMQLRASRPRRTTCRPSRQVTYATLLNGTHAVKHWI
jgi:hypothetical protein